MRRIILYAALIATPCLFAHEDNNKPLFDYGQVINSHNSKGQKEGLWISDLEDVLTSFSWFQDGKREGVCFAWYHYSNTVDQIEFFYQDSSALYIGIDEQGHVESIMVCGNNDEFTIMNVDGSLYMPDYKSYCKEYYPNGQLESEGFLVWNRGDEIVSGDTVKCGIWKYYDRNGIITTKEYPHGNMRMNSPEKRLDNNNDDLTSGVFYNNTRANESKSAFVQNKKPIDGTSFDFGQAINQYNSLGQKHGLWIITDGDSIVYECYSEGRKDGISFSRSVTTNILSWFDYSVNGELKALIHLYDGREGDQSFSIGSVKSIHIGGINEEFRVINQDGTSFIPYYKAYTKYFYPDRRTQSEGFLVWDKGGTIEKNSIACGEWKYFDREGRMIITNYSTDGE